MSPTRDIKNDVLESREQLEVQWEGAKGRLEGVRAGGSFIFKILTYSEHISF